MLTHLVDMEVLRMIDDAVGAVSDAFLQRMTSKLEPVKEGENALGVLHDETARRLWCVSHIFDSRSSIAAGQSGSAEDEIEGDRLKQEACKFKDLAHVARQLFWAHAGNETGVWDKSLGVRTDWMIAATPPCQAHANPFLKMLGMGGTPE